MRHILSTVLTRHACVHSLWTSLVWGSCLVGYDIILCVWCFFFFFFEVTKDESRNDFLNSWCVIVLLLWCQPFYHIPLPPKSLSTLYNIRHLASLPIFLWQPRGKKKQSRPNSQANTKLIKLTKTFLDGRNHSLVPRSVYCKKLKPVQCHVSKILNASEAQCSQCSYCISCMADEAYSGCKLVFIFYL